MPEALWSAGAFDVALNVVSEKLRGKRVDLKIAKEAKRYATDIESIVAWVSDPKLPDNPNGYSLDFIGHCPGTEFVLGNWTIGVGSATDITPFSKLRDAIATSQSTNKPITTVRLLGCDTGSLATGLQQYVNTMLNMGRANVGVGAAQRLLSSTSFGWAGLKCGISAPIAPELVPLRVRDLGDKTLDLAADLRTTTRAKLEAWRARFPETSWPLVHATRSNGELMVESLCRSARLYEAPGLLTIPSRQYWFCDHDDSGCTCASVREVSLMLNDENAYLNTRTFGELALVPVNLRSWFSNI